MKEITKSDIDLKSPIKILDLSTWMDGGSILLHCGNKLNQEFKIEFQQNMIIDMEKYDRLPGRIYLNNELVKDQSELENSVIKGLEKAEFDIVYSEKKFKRMDKKLLNEKLEYVKSNKYIFNNKLITNKLNKKSI
ncbi:hypothetical protein [Aquimarina sp. Aq78]|uniref:hypothetical protein n=1 Tax=Aquimarina sp. Aq78 TaxID=1191889 RepID=UPI000D0F5CBC|nr:hypothetical protein [Aquimarina sp. Aq78]